MAKNVAKFAKRERIGEAQLREAIERAEQGLIDADLSGGLIKLRIARQGQGRSGGYRTIVSYRKGDLAVFLYAFAKNDKENIEPEYLIELRKLGFNWINSSPEDVTAAIEAGTLREIGYAEK